MMHLTEMNPSLLLQLVAFACGIGWVITGSVIGKLCRIFWHVITGWIPRRPLASLAFCPPCCTWWCGAFLAVWAHLPWYNVLQIAFTSCVLMAICNSQWQMDAGDRDEIERLLWSEHGERPEKQPNKESER